MDPVRDYVSLFKDLQCLLVREKEGEGNQHYHCYVKGSHKAKLDTRLKKYFKGNNKYSCKVVKDTVNQCRYLCKGTESEKPVVIMNNINVDVNEEYKRYWQDRIEYKERVKKEKKGKVSIVPLDGDKAGVVPDTAKTVSSIAPANTTPLSVLILRASTSPVKKAIGK